MMESTPNGHGKNGHGKLTVERSLLILTFSASVIALIFGAGVNWAHITEQDAALKAFERTYLRSDVYAADQRRLSESLDRLSEELKALRYQPSPTPDSQRTTPRQRFDR
jgi:hypothetical protein